MHKRIIGLKLPLSQSRNGRLFRLCAEVRRGADSDPDSVPLNGDPERPTIAGLSRPDMRGLGVQGTRLSASCFCRHVQAVSGTDKPRLDGRLPF